jgi:hypothetical protein
VRNGPTSRIHAGGPGGPARRAPVVLLSPRDIRGRLLRPANDNRMPLHLKLRRAVLLVLAGAAAVMLFARMLG